jgi:hypothetical protein
VKSKISAEAHLENKLRFDVHLILFEENFIDSDVKENSFDEKSC